MLHLPWQIRVRALQISVTPSVLFWFVQARRETDSVLIQKGQYDEKIYRFHGAVFSAYLL